MIDQSYSASRKCLELFKSLADETRLRALHILLHHEMSVNEVAEALGLLQSGISRQLKAMAEAGLLTARRDGLWCFYSAAASGPGREFVDAVRHLFEQDPELAEDLQKARLVVEGRSRETTRFFNAIAPTWSGMSRRILQGLDLAAEITNRMPVCDVAADLGCGAGDLLPVLAAKARLVIGVDSSPRMIDEARRRLPADMPAERFSLRIGTLEHLPLRDAEADFILLSMVLHHLSSPAKGLLEARRALRPGGILMIVDLLRHEQERMRTRYGDRWLGFATADLAQWLMEAGLRPGEPALFDVKSGLRVVILTGTNP